MTKSWFKETVGRLELPVWTRAHAAEILPDAVRPLDFDLLLSQAAGPAWRAELVGRLGFRPNEIPADGPPLIGIFEGRAYLNASTLRVWAQRTPVLGPHHADAAYLGPGLPDYEPVEWHDHPAATDGSLNQWLRRVLVDGTRPELDELCAEADQARRSRPDFAVMLDDEVHARIVELQPLVGRLMAQHLHQMLAASVGPGIIAAICVERGLPTEASHLIAGLGQLDTTAPVAALWALSRLVAHSAPATAEFDRGLSGLAQRLRDSTAHDVAGLAAGVETLAGEVGPLGSSSWELTAIPARSATDTILQALDWLRRCPDELDPRPRMAAVASARRELVEEVAGPEPATEGAEATDRAQFLVAVRATEIHVRGRERLGRAIGMTLDEIRAALWELGLRAASRNDVTHPDDLRYLFGDELAYYADGGLSAIGELVAERRQRLAEVAAGPAPAMIDVRHRPQRLFPLEQPAQLEAGGIVMGRPVSSNVGRGTARIIDDPARLAEIEPGAVLVAATASTSWLPFIIGAAAVVTEAGGLLGHLSILCRELGTPLVVGIDNAPIRFVEGSLLEVDGLTGIVSVIEDAPTAAVSPTVVTLDPWGVA
ncbi:MAG: PEP-utilizing enzyme [Actinomycetota bacterium]